MAFDEELPSLTADERAWRCGWAFAYSGVANLYGDDGELQDNRNPAIDWLRDPPLEISRKIRERAELQWKAAMQAKQAHNARVKPRRERCGDVCERSECTQATQRNGVGLNELLGCCSGRFN